MRVLLCWLGYADLHAAEGKPEAGLGPIGQAARERAFDEIVVLSDHDEGPTERYERWLQAQSEARVQVRIERLSSPTHFGDIYRAVCRTLEDLTNRHGENVRLAWERGPLARKRSGRDARAPGEEPYMRAGRPRSQGRGVRGSAKQ